MIPIVVYGNDNLHIEKDNHNETYSDIPGNFYSPC
ncbi:hypothetical protein NGUA41_02935 [Salmonella enterica]|nr:hypothetical protein NGUA40_01325 [Salmonella enterica]GAS78059.1 hypothetical protein NGUA41_02935 [Salmonella enterica]